MCVCLFYVWPFYFQIDKLYEVSTFLPLFEKKIAGSHDIENIFKTLYSDFPLFFFQDKGYIMIKSRHHKWIIMVQHRDLRLKWLFSIIDCYCLAVLIKDTREVFKFTQWYFFTKITDFIALRRHIVCFSFIRVRLQGLLNKTRCCEYMYAWYICIYLDLYPGTNYLVYGMDN